MNVAANRSEFDMHLKMALDKAGGPFLLAKELKVSLKAIHNWLNGKRVALFRQRAQQVYNYINTPGKNREKTVVEKVWQVIRILPVFTIKEVAAATECSYVSVRDIIRKLVNAGYVIRIQQQTPLKKLLTGLDYLKLVKNTGPKAPKIGPHSKVTDCNKEVEYD
ncbi:MAG: hypothetical protein WDA26_13330 [Pusillimonas sp.]